MSASGGVGRIGVIRREYSGLEKLVTAVDSLHMALATLRDNRFVESADNTTLSRNIFKSVSEGKGGDEELDKLAQFASTIAVSIRSIPIRRMARDFTTAEDLHGTAYNGLRRLVRDAAEYIHSFQPSDESVEAQLRTRIDESDSLLRGA